MSTDGNKEGQGFQPLGSCEREGCGELGFRLEHEAMWVCPDCRTTERVRELETALRNVALQCGSYMCEGENGPVVRCLYCSGDDDPCVACQINTFLDDKDYVGKGAHCDRDYLVRKGWRDDA